MTEEKVMLIDGNLSVIFQNADDTIESLSAKLATANMERSERYYDLSAEKNAWRIGKLQRLKEVFAGLVDTEFMETIDAAIYALELPERHYSGGWIACKDRLPKENDVVILTFRNSAGIHVGEATFKKDAFYYVTDTVFGYYDELHTTPLAWMPLPEPYHPNEDTANVTEKAEVE